MSYTLTGQIADVEGVYDVYAVYASAGAAKCAGAAMAKAHGVRLSWVAKAAGCYESETPAGEDFKADAELRIAPLR